MDLKDVRSAVILRLGEPISTLSLRHGGASAIAPVELDILIIPDSDADNPTTDIATAGMSMMSMPGPIARAELAMRIHGRHSQQELDAMARQLGDIAVLPFLEGFGLSPDMVLGNVQMSPFVGKDSIMIGDWGIAEPQWLEGLDSPVCLLEIVPLFSSEAEVVREIGVVEAHRRFFAEGVDPYEPGRTEAVLKPRDVPQYDPRAIEPPIGELWDRLETWLGATAPRIRAQLRSGASEQELTRFEASLAERLPDDFRESLMRHDGNAQLSEYRYMSLDEVEQTWCRQIEVTDTTKPSASARTYDDSGQIFQPVWWHRGWIPFAEDSAGNLLCIDVSPGPRGVRGQVIRWQVDTGPEATRRPSFVSWLDAYFASLQSGIYIVDEEGSIVRKAI